MTKALAQTSRASAEIVEMTTSVRASPGSKDGKPMVEVSGLCKSYGGLEVLKGCDLFVGRGEVVVILRTFGLRQEYPDQMCQWP